MGVRRTNGKWMQRQRANRITNDIEQLTQATAKHGKMAGVVCTEENCGSLVDMGCNFLNIAVDLAGLHSYYKDSIKRFEDIMTGLVNNK